MTLMTNVRVAMQKHLAYRRLKHELRTMPTETAIDLGMFREDAGKVAARAVYG